jgi:ribonucleoside-diphosphate reductase alpha chain
LNYYPIPQAAVTNKKMRAIGIGMQGYHHALALKGIKWESEDHLFFSDEYTAKWSFGIIKASMELAKERGHYPECPGSDWMTGTYFDKRNLTDIDQYGLDWAWLKKQCMKYGVRNGNLMAIAPTGSTSVVSGSSAGIDPIMDKYWLEEKKGLTVPMTAPDLSPQTFWYYIEAHNVDQMWSIRANAVRQKYIDQGQSFNLYIKPEETSLREVFNLYHEAWRLGVKTVYYMRSKSLEVEDCVSCSA